MFIYPSSIIVTAMPIYISKFISVRIYRPTMVFLKPLRESIGFRAYIEIIESIDKKSKSILRMSITKNTLIFCLGIVLIPIERAFAQRISQGL